jgi:FkbM family methyltransferase
MPLSEAFQQQRSELIGSGSEPQKFGFLVKLVRRFIWLFVRPFHFYNQDKIFILQQSYDDLNIRLSNITDEYSKSVANYVALRSEIAASINRQLVSEVRIEEHSNLLASYPDIITELQKFDRQNTEITSLSAEIRRIENQNQEWKAELRKADRQNQEQKNELSKNILLFTSTPDGIFLVKSGDIISDSVARGDTWDGHILAIASEIAKSRRGVAIDVGSHFGIITVALANQFERVISFEPNEFNYRILRANISINSLNNVESFNNALYSKSVELSLGDNQHQEIVIPLDEHGKFDGISAPNLGAFSFSEHGTGIFKNDARTLDSYNLENISFIKIDAQGADGEVIVGAMETIKRCMPVVVFEWEEHLSENFSVQFDTIDREFKHIGYEVSVLKKHNEKQIDYIARPVILDEMG